MASTTTTTARAQTGEARGTRAETLTPRRQPIVIKPFRIAVYIVLTFGALIFVLPLYLTASVGLTIMQTGLVLAAMAIGAFASGAAPYQRRAARQPSTGVSSVASL